MGVLAVEIDEVVSELGQRRRRRHPTVDVGPRAARRSGPPARATTSRSPATKRPSTTASAAPARTIAASARPPRSSSSASTTSVLPAPVSPVRAVMPGRENEIEVGDDTEVAHSQLDQHRLAQRSVRPKRARSAAWKSRTPKLTSRAGSAAARHSTLSPRFEADDAARRR